MDHLFAKLPRETLKDLTKTQLITLVEGEQQIRAQLEDQNSKLRERCNDLKEQVLEIDGKFVRLRDKIFGKSSEVRPDSDRKKNSGRKGKKGRRGSSTKKPSERYPNLPIIDKELKLETLPDCGSCGNQMAESSLWEVAEELSVTPRKYEIIRYHRQKYRCSCCQGSLVTTPALPRIIPGSAYSDQMILDIALSKYCDLIPIERMSAMAQRSGVEGLPPNSLISLTHKLADFLCVIYEKGLRLEILDSDVIRADESPHKMLEGDETKNWFLWQFSCENAVYFECHNTRSGDVASEILMLCGALALLSDDYAGYGKALRETNQDRATKSLAPILHQLCNAHSRRKFIEAEAGAEAATYYIDQYSEIYTIEAEAIELEGSARIEKRATAAAHFEAMKSQAEEDSKKFSARSHMAAALRYFLKNYQQLTLFLTMAVLPIDNNASERNLRSPVVGRKTWYGTHSKKGARTAAILFSIVESCKINKVNPREYFATMVQRMHNGQGWCTPSQFPRRDDTS